MSIYPAELPALGEARKKIKEIVASWIDSIQKPVATVQEDSNGNEESITIIQPEETANAETNEVLLSEDVTVEPNKISNETNEVVTERPFEDAKDQNQSSILESNNESEKVIMKEKSNKNKLRNVKLVKDPVKKLYRKTFEDDEKFDLENIEELLDDEFARQLLKRILNLNQEDKNDLRDKLFKKILMPKLVAKSWPLSTKF